MPNLSTKEIIWCFGILVGFGGIPLGLFFANQDLSASSSYTRVIPSITYVAVSIMTVALIEIFDLSIIANKKKIDEELKKTLIIQISTIVICAFIYFTTFVKNISKANTPDYQVGWFEISINVAMIVLAATLVIRMKRLLESLS
ncbi:hypothetical protein [Mesorhizobium sp. 10J20-29]